MNRFMRPAGFPATLLVPRWIMLARETFEASVAIHYDAPWQRTASRAGATADPAS